MNRFFHDVIEPSVQSLPVLRVIHSEHHNGRDFRIVQTVSRNVYTDFDRSLSRHLAATGGESFPAYTVAVEVAEGTASDRKHHLVSGFHESVPHAIKELADRAIKRAGPVELTFHRSKLKTGQDPSIALKRKVGPAEVETLRMALSICEDLGDAEFLDVSGDFGIIIARPPGKLDPVVMHLNNGTVSVPSSTTPGSAPFQWPVYAFADHASSNLAAQNYLAGVGHAMLLEKEAAIREFRELAERRVVGFNQALAGRRLEGHWLDAAEALLARLKVGLGDQFIGIAEDAQGIALDLVGVLEGMGRRVAAPQQSAADSKPRADKITTSK